MRYSHLPTHSLTSFSASTPVGQPRWSSESFVSPPLGRQSSLVASRDLLPPFVLGWSWSAELRHPLFYREWRCLSSTPSSTVIILKPTFFACYMDSSSSLMPVLFFGMNDEGGLIFCDIASLFPLVAFFKHRLEFNISVKRGGGGFFSMDFIKQWMTYCTIGAGNQANLKWHLELTGWKACCFVKNMSAYVS